jgi:hypothetical protein
VSVSPSAVIIAIAWLLFGRSADAQSAVSGTRSSVPPSAGRQHSLKVDSLHASIGHPFRYAAIAEYLPIYGAMFGLETPNRLSLRATEVVYGGTLGKVLRISPGDAANKIVLFDAPVRSDGQPDYDLRPVREQLAQYRRAAAILVTTLDLMPRVIVEQTIDPPATFRSEESAHLSSAAIIAITPSIRAALLPMRLSLALRYVRD